MRSLLAALAVVSCIALMSAYAPYATDTCIAADPAAPVVTLTGAKEATIRVHVSKPCILWKDSTGLWASKTLTPRNLGLSGCTLVRIVPVVDDLESFDVVVKPSVAMSITVFGNSTQDAGGLKNQQARWNK